jgi:ferritin
MATLKKEIYQHLKIDEPANSQKNDDPVLYQKVRELLEKAYEEEKSKSIISKKSNRIYNELLKSRDEELFDHLVTNQVSPEL